MFLLRDAYTKSFEFTRQHEELEQVNEALANIPSISNSGRQLKLLLGRYHTDTFHQHPPASISNRKETKRYKSIKFQSKAGRF